MRVCVVRALVSVRVRARESKRFLREEGVQVLHEIRDSLARTPTARGYLEHLTPWPMHAHVPSHML